MAHPTYNELTAAELSVDRIGDEDVLENIRDNIRSLRRYQFAHRIGSTLTNSTTSQSTYAVMPADTLVFPASTAWTGYAPRVTCRFYVWISGGSPTAELRLDVSGYTAGSWIEVTSTSSTNVAEIYIDLDSNALDTTRGLDLEYRLKSGTGAGEVSIAGGGMSHTVEF